MAFTTPIHTNEQSIDRVLRAGLPVLLVFWRSRDCAPCEQLNPMLDSLASAYAGKILIAKVDVGDNPALVARYDVTQLPSLVFVRDGRETARGAGAAPQASLRAWLDGLLDGAGISGAHVPPPSGPSVAVTGARTSQAAPHAAQGVPPRPTPSPQAEQSRPAAGSTAHPVVLTDQTFEQTIGQSDRPVLVDFWAPWCGPCRMVAPAVEQLAREFAGKAVVAKLNIDENPRTAQRYGIMSIPALYIFRGGQVVERLVGAQPAPVLRQALAKHAR